MSIGALFDYGIPAMRQCNNMFYDEIKKYDWDETTRCIASKRAADVETALGKTHPDVDDFMALISPAAAPYLEDMAQISRRITQERFGKTISMYIPLYILSLIHI